MMSPKKKPMHGRTGTPSPLPVFSAFMVHFMHCLVYKMPRSVGHFDNIDLSEFIIPAR